MTMKRCRVALVKTGVGVAIAAVAALAWGGGSGTQRPPATAGPASTATTSASPPAVDALTAAANAGDIAAQLTLGKMYLHGVPGVAKDPAFARTFFEHAANGGSASGAYYLGVTAQTGDGTAVDAAKGAQWLEVAANRGSPHAMFLLGNACRAGAGVPKSPARALAMYEHAAELGHPAALQALSMAYLQGELGLEPDPIESRRYAMEAEHALEHAPPGP